MHKIAIPDYIVERVRAQRGRTQVFDHLEGRSSALVVVDLQNAFMLPGMPLEVPIAREIVPNVNRLASATRAAGGTVIWIKMTYADEGRRWSVFFDHFMTPEQRAASLKVLSRGDHGHALHAQLDARPDDPVVEKTRFSAFVPGSSDLDRMLRDRGIDTLVIVGCVTNTCCECTARDAMMLNYKTVFVSDANAARTDDEHNAALANIMRIFGDVLSTDEVVARLSRG